jgi:hypothetical protein
VLLTNATLAHRTGTEVNVRDIAMGLLRRGHHPVVYTRDPGQVADELRAATVPVVGDLNRIAAAPDVIHGHHHPETMMALLQFVGVPAVFFSHDFVAWQDAAPRFPRILRYVAVDETNRDRLVLEQGIPDGLVHVLPNAVDLERFRPRPPLPDRPARALVFSNYASEATHLAAVRAACARRGLALDVVGDGVGAQSPAPERILGDYDLVFAKGRCALEALAVGTAVVLCDYAGAGPLVTSADLGRLRALNFGRRALRVPLSDAWLAHQIDRYDARDAAEVARRVRAAAGLDAQLDALEGLYRGVIADNASRPQDLAAEERALAAYLDTWGPRFKDGPLRALVEHYRTSCERLWADREHLHGECVQLRARVEHVEAALQTAGGERDALVAARDERTARDDAEHAAALARTTEFDRLRAEGDRLRADVRRLTGELAWMRETAAWRLRAAVVRSRVLAAAYRALRRVAALAWSTPPFAPRAPSRRQSG